MGSGDSMSTRSGARQVRRWDEGGDRGYSGCAREGRDQGGAMEKRRREMSVH